MTTDLRRAEAALVLSLTPPQPPRDPIGHHCDWAQPICLHSDLASMVNLASISQLFLDPGLLRTL